MLLGLNVSTSSAPGVDPVAFARRAEQLGFDFVSASDHPCGSNSTYETWTMLTWIAAATSRIRVATRVLGVPYRPPPMVAKMAETLNRLSGNRLILGLGGGSSDEEFRAFGLGERTAGQKVTGLEEAVSVIRGLWSQQAFTFDGRLYQTSAAELEPKPEHHIPIWLGTFGPQALALTGRLADGWIPSLGYAPPERIPAMRERVLAGAAEAGRDPDQVTCVYNVPVRVTDRPESDPGLVSGRAEDIVERLGGFAELGFTGLNLMLPEAERADQLDRVGAEVVPRLRAAAR